MSFRIRKGDTVLVATGKDRGATGRVLRVFPKRQRAIVEGVNFIKRHERRRRRGQAGGIIEQEAPVHMSNLAIMCPKCNQPTRIGAQVTEAGAKTRICRKCGASI